MTDVTNNTIEQAIKSLIDQRLRDFTYELPTSIEHAVMLQLDRLDLHEKIEQTFDGQEFTYKVERIIEDTDFSESIEEQVTNYMDNNVDIESVVQEELDRRIDDIDEKVNEALDARWDENDFDRRLENKIAEMVGDINQNVSALLDARWKLLSDELDAVLEAKLEEMLTRLFSRMISK